MSLQAEIVDGRVNIYRWDIGTLSFIPWDGSLTVGSLTIGAVTQSGTWTVQPGNTANTTAWKVDGSAVVQPVSSATLATAANQATEIASLASIDGKTPALGQQVAAASSPVVLTAAQIATLTPVLGLTDAQLRATPVPVSGTVAVTSATLATEATLASLAAEDFSTAAKQDTGNAALATLVLQTDGVETSLSSIDGKLTSGIVISSMPASASAATATEDDPTYTEGVAEPLSQDLSGRMRTLGYGLVSDAVPVYIPEQVEPLSLTTEGRLRVTVVPAATYIEMFRESGSLFFGVPILASDTPYIADVPNNPWGM